MTRAANRKAKMSAITAKAQANVDSIQRSEAERSPSRRIPVGQIARSPHQARRDFGSLDELTADIQQRGVLQPILVRTIGEDRYELVAGERRWRAAQAAGLERIPAVVREMTDREALVAGLSENLQRENLNAYEIARAVVELVAAQTGHEAEEVRVELGTRQPPEELLQEMEAALGLLNKGLTLRTFQRHYLPLLRLDPELIEALEQGAPYAAVLLLRGATPEQRAEWLPRVLAGATVQQVEAGLKQPKPAGESGTYDWEGRVKSVKSGLSAQRLERLDGRQKRRARRLLEELETLLGGGK